MEKKYFTFISNNGESFENSFLGENNELMTEIDCFEFQLFYDFDELQGEWNDDRTVFVEL